MYPKIEKQEYSLRLEKLRSAMAAEGIDLAVGFSNLLDPSAVRYLCGFAGVNESAAIIIPLTGEVTVCSGQASYDYAQIANSLEGSVIKVFPEIGEVSGFEYDYEGQLEFGAYFKEVKAAHKIKKVAILGKLIFPAIIFGKLNEVFSGCEIVDFDSRFYELRMIKSPAEILCMQRASDIISQTFSHVMPQIRAGMTELDIQAEFEAEMLRRGAESYVQAFAPMVATGEERSHISMTRNTPRVVSDSEMLNIAAGACYEGYNGMICAPHVLGRIPASISDAVKCAYDALNTAAALMKPGARADEILNTYTSYLDKAGYLEYCPYGSLHSIGMIECEAPLFSVANRRVLQEGMTMCIDAYFKNLPFGSFRLEDTYVITATGVKRMTSYSEKNIPLVFGFAVDAGQTKYSA